MISAWTVIVIKNKMEGNPEQQEDLYLQEELEHLNDKSSSSSKWNQNVNQSSVWATRVNDLD